MGEKTSNDILSESAQQICSPKFMHTPRKGLYQSYINNCEISNFGFWHFFLFFFGTFNMIVNLGIIKCVISWKPLVVERKEPKFGPRG